MGGTAGLGSSAGGERVERRESWGGEPERRRRVGGVGREGGD
jgi:hypothetical protein